MKKIIYLTISLFSLFTITACQKTPESPIVRGKDIDNIIEKAIESPIVADADSEDDLRRPLEAPEKLVMEMEGVKGNLKIHVDADVIVPDTEGMPVARVTMGQFSEEDVKNLYEALSGDAKPIDPDSQPSSEYYLQRVQELRELKKSGDYDEKFSSTEEIDRAINELMKQAASAPDSFEPVEPDFSFKDNQDEGMGSIGPYVRLRFMPDDNTISEINVVQDLYGSGAFAEYIRDNTKGSEANALEIACSFPIEQGILPTIGEDEAQKLAQDTITKLGLFDFTCTGKRISTIYNDMPPSGEPIDQNEAVYEFMFTRKINDVPITYTNDDGLTTVHEAYHRPWMYEKIRIFIDDDGVFYLKWNSPYVVKEIVSDASTMLPFSDIQAIFQKMAPMKYEVLDSDERYSYEMKVTEARLGLMRVTEKDVGDSGLIIPVWDFFGTLMRKDGQYEVIDGRSEEYNAFLTINAIDGSIIDRELGY